MNTARINPPELSSRKLWQLADTQSEFEISREELSEVIAELAKRCHDLEKLEEINKLEQEFQS